MSKVNLVILAQVNPEKKEALSHYVNGVGELYQQVGAKSVGKFKLSEALIGTAPRNLASIMEFPDMNALRAVFDSDAYQALLPYRDQAFLSLEAHISA